MTRTTYRVGYGYGFCFGSHQNFTTLKEAWNFYKNLKNHNLTDRADISKITETKKHFWSKVEITSKDIIDWTR